MDRAVDAHRERVDQGGARLRRAHRDDGRFGAEPFFEIDRLRDRSQVVGADDIDTVALDGLGDRIEVGVVDDGNLLDTNGDLAHGVTPDFRGYSSVARGCNLHRRAAGRLIRDGR